MKLPIVTLGILLTAATAALPTGASAACAMRTRSATCTQSSSGSNYTFTCPSTGLRYSAFGDAWSEAVSREAAYCNSNCTGTEWFFDGVGTEPSYRCVNQPIVDSLYSGSGYTVGGPAASAHVRVFAANPGAVPTFARMLYIVGPFSFGAAAGVEAGMSCPLTMSGTEQLYCRLGPDFQSAARVAGVDVAIIDFDGSVNQPLQTKSALTRSMLDTFRTLSGGTLRPSVMVGLSLGGVVARHALTTLEKSGPFPHNVRHYISFDSPHGGAHVPYGLQQLPGYLQRAFDAARRGNNDTAALLDNLSSIFGPGYLTDRYRRLLDSAVTTTRMGSATAAALFEGYFNTPAARQLLVENVLANGRMHADGLQLQSELAALGFPAKTERNIAIVNGAEALSFTPSPSSLTFVSTRNNQSSLSFSIAPDSIYGPTMLGRLNYFAADSFGYKTYTETLSLPSGTPAYDNRPCSTTDLPTSMKLLLEGTTTSPGPLEVAWPNSSMTAAPASCFVPSVSAAGGTYSDITTRSVTDVRARNVANAAARAAGQVVPAFDEIVGTGCNEKHMNVNNRVLATIQTSFNRVYLGASQVDVFLPPVSCAAPPPPPTSNILASGACSFYTCEGESRTCSSQGGRFVQQGSSFTCYAQ